MSERQLNPKLDAAIDALVDAADAADAVRTGQAEAALIDCIRKMLAKSYRDGWIARKNRTNDGDYNLWLTRSNKAADALLYTRDGTDE